MDGYNVSIFAYGQTGSGKTYTMEGPSDNPGVNLRALKYLFKIQEERSPQFQYKIKLSVFEIYNEKINDLITGAEEVLNPSSKKKKKKEKKNKKDGVKFKVRHLPDGSVEVEGLTKVLVSSESDILKLNKIAKKNRSASATDMNAHSSRSHMLLVCFVSGINIPANIKYFGKLYLVDLAGSERVKKSGAKGQALKEAQNINKSLSALGDVMQALQQKQKVTSYKNSILTELMANALGGNAKIIMLINCCPAKPHACETVSSLNFVNCNNKKEISEFEMKNEIDTQIAAPEKQNQEYKLQMQKQLQTKEDELKKKEQEKLAMEKQEKQKDELNDKYEETAEKNKNLQIQTQEQQAMINKLQEIIAGKANES
eukprot:439972_1